MPDHILISQFNRNNKEAFRTVYSRFIDPINNYAAQFLTHQDAEDVTAETFIKLFQESKKNFKDIEHVKSWLLHCTRNACLDKIRRDKTKTNVYTEFSARIEKETPRWIDEREKMEIQQFYFRYIYEYMDGMPEFKRDVFRLAFIEGRKNPEVALILHTTENKIRDTKKRILQNLRHVLAEKKIAFLLIAFLADL